MFCPTCGKETDKLQEYRRPEERQAEITKAPHSISPDNSTIST
jgi:uncharacterized Zn finger protein (UPF0148 family)